MGRHSISTHSKKMRNFIGIVKDKVSFIKASLLVSKRTNVFHIAVLQATTHAPADPPPETTVEEVLSLGHHHRAAASTIVDSLLRRLRRTRNAYVALKCLLTLHHLLSRGTPVFKFQISSAIGPHNNPLNLRSFRDQSDADTWELSRWVRWYAGVLEQGLSSSFYLSPFSGERPRRRSLREIVFKEMGDLVAMMEEICKAPESLKYERMGLVYEVMKLVGEDYRKIMREIVARIGEVGRGGIEELAEEEVNELMANLKKMEECKEKVMLMFVNKKMRDGGWDLIGQTRKEIQSAMQQREGLRVVIRIRGKGNKGKGRPRGNKWLDVPWNSSVVPKTF